MILYQFSNIFRGVGSIWGHFGAIQGHQGQFQKAQNDPNFVIFIMRPKMSLEMVKNDWAKILWKL